MGEGRPESLSLAISLTIFAPDCLDLKKNWKGLPSELIKKFIENISFFFLKTPVTFHTVFLVLKLLCASLEGLHMWLRNFCDFLHEIKTKEKKRQNLKIQCSSGQSWQEKWLEKHNYLKIKSCDIFFSLCTKCKQKMPNMLSLMKKNKQKTLRKKKTLQNKQKRLHKQLRLSFLYKWLFWTLREIHWTL